MTNRPLRVAVPDLVSPSYLPMLAAVEMGFLAQEGVDASIELRFPVTEAAHALKAGEIDVLAGAAHAPLVAFPDWAGVKLLCALSTQMYWYLVARPDLGEVGDPGSLRGLRLGAAPGPDLGIIALLEAEGMVAGVDYEIGPIPSASPTTSFGIGAAQALEKGLIDGYWANGMGAAVSVRSRTGRVILDVRRGLGPAAAAAFTFPAAFMTAENVEHEASVAPKVQRAVVRAHQAMIQNPDSALEVGRALFPPLEASMIGDLARADAPFYRAAVTEAQFAVMQDFAVGRGLLSQRQFYDDVVVRVSPT